MKPREKKNEWNENEETNWRFRRSHHTFGCMFVTIKIVPQSTYALISLNENGKVAGEHCLTWAGEMHSAPVACASMYVCLCLYLPLAPSKMTHRKKCGGKVFRSFWWFVCVGVGRHCSPTIQSWKFYYTPMRINGTFNQFWHTPKIKIAFSPGHYTENASELHSEGIEFLRALAAATTITIFAGSE